MNSGTVAASLLNFCLHFGKVGNFRATAWAVCISWISLSTGFYWRET